MLECPNAESRFPMETEFKANVLDVCSDWIGQDARPRGNPRRVAGLVVNGCCLRSWSSAQATVATSSGEAESMLQCAARRFGISSRGVSSFALHCGWIRRPVDLVKERSRQNQACRGDSSGSRKWSGGAMLWCRESRVTETPLTY